MITFDFVNRFSSPSLGQVYINQFASPIPDLNSTICDWWLGNIYVSAHQTNYDYTIWFGYADRCDSQASSGNIFKLATVRNFDTVTDVKYQLDTFEGTGSQQWGSLTSTSTRDTSVGLALENNYNSPYETASIVLSNTFRQGVVNIMEYGNSSGTGSPLANPYVYLCYGVLGYNQGDVDGILNNMNDYGFGFLTYNYDFSSGCKVNIGGGSNSWEDITGIKVNVGGEWKPVTGIKTWVTNQWKDARGSNTPIIGPYM